MRKDLRGLQSHFCVNLTFAEDHPVVLSAEQFLLPFVQVPLTPETKTTKHVLDQEIFKTLQMQCVSFQIQLQHPVPCFYTKCASASS